MPAAARPLFAARQLVKAYAVPVLRGVDVTIAGGDVHALVGANGAGKTTLARILCGLVRADGGDMELDGEAYSPASKLEAEAAGVQIVQQELNLIGTLSVAENLGLGRFPVRRGLIDRKELLVFAREALRRVGLEDLAPERRADSLGIGVQQLVEIARALSRQTRLLVLDEPTAALTAPQVDALFENVRKITASGASVLYISHRLEELSEVADRITILRDGRVVRSDVSSRLEREEIVRQMAGRELEALTPRHQSRTGTPAIRVEGLGVRRRLKNVSFVIHRGEIFGISGLVGAGRTRLLRTIFGAETADEGGVGLGRDGPLQRFASPLAATRAGLAMIPEDRKRDGLLLPRSLQLNVTLASLEGRGWLPADFEAKLAEKGAEVLDIQRADIHQPVIELSGGNQQKVVVARWLLRDQAVLLFDEPTRGIDVAARASLYRLLQDLADAGKAILLASSDLDELICLCDRIGVMSRGRLVTILERRDFSRAALTAAAIA